MKVNNSKIQCKHCSKVLKVYERLENLKCMKLTDSSTVQVIFISPGTSVIKDSPLLCMCKECKNEFGSSSLYKGYELIVQHLNKVSSRSNFVNEYTPDCERAGTAVNEFVATDSVVAVATPDKHTDTEWFIMVISNEYEYE